MDRNAKHSKGKMGIPLRAMQNGQRTEKADEYPNPHEQTRTQVGQLWPVIALGE